jgi:hypothetical protein
MAQVDKLDLLKVVAYKLEHNHKLSLIALVIREAIAEIRESREKAAKNAISIPHEAIQGTDPAAIVIISSEYLSGPFREYHAFENDQDARVFAAKRRESATLYRIHDWIWHKEGDSG